MIRNKLKALFASGTGNEESRFAKAYIRQIDDLQEQDVYICGDPKSGHTWLSHLLANSVFGVDSTISPGKLVMAVIPDVDLLRGAYYLRFHDRMVFKTEVLPQPGMKRVINIVRDGRDALVSLYSMLCNSSKFDGTFEEFLDQKEYGLDWSKHVLEWHRNPFGAEILQIRYEDLHRGTAVELKRILEFLGEQRSDDAIERAVSSSSFQTLRQRELDSYRHDINKSQDVRFFRKGQVGDYTQYFYEAQLGEFRTRYSEAMSVCGYPC